MFPPYIIYQCSPFCDLGGYFSPFPTMLLARAAPEEKYAQAFSPMESQDV